MSLSEVTSERIKSLVIPGIGAGVELGRQELVTLISPTGEHLQTLELSNPFHWEANFAVITSRISQFFTMGLFLAGEQARVSRTGKAAHWLLSFTRGAVALATPAIATASVKAIEVLGDSSANFGDKFGAGFVALTALFAVGSMAESAIQILRNRNSRAEERLAIKQESAAIMVHSRQKDNHAAQIEKHLNSVRQYNLSLEAEALLTELAEKNYLTFFKVVNNLDKYGAQQKLTFVAVKTLQMFLPEESDE